MTPPLRRPSNVHVRAANLLTGALVGQDGWIKNTYYGAMNGTVNVSNSSPLGGTQSVSYVETGAGLSDVGRVGAIAVQDIQGTDVTLSYTIKGTPRPSAARMAACFLATALRLAPARFSPAIERGRRGSWLGRRVCASQRVLLSALAKR